MAEVDIPDFLYSGLYFPQWQQDLRRYRRINTPEISDEDPHEPFTQLEDMLAFIGHAMGVLLDHVALEAMYPTARLRESVRDHLALIGEKLSQATPAVVDILCKLPAPQAVDGTLKKFALFSTNPTETAAAIPFETQADREVRAGNVLSHAWENDGGTFVDRKVKLNTDADTFQPWAGVPAAGDALYVGHDSVVWDTVWFKYAVEGTIWSDADLSVEYYDGQVTDINPTAVADQGGGTMRMNLTSLLGIVDRHGASVVVTSRITGARVTKTSVWNVGGNGLNTVDVTITEMGIGAASTVATDFLVGSEWKEIPSKTLADDTTGKQKKYAYTLPETAMRKWQKVNLKTNLGGNAPDVSAYWMRLRIVNATATSPTFDRAYINQGGQYFLVAATQGTTFSEPIFGVSTGGASQVFTTARDKIVEDTVVLEIDEGSGYKTWSEVDTFLTSQSTSRHYRVNYDPDGTAIIMFGDGTNGKIPVLNSPIKATYRVEAEEAGNVGAGTVVINRSGFALISSVTNPRAAAGWKMPEGATDTDLESVKIEKPANLRARKRVMSHADIQAVAKEWVAADGTKPFARATIIDEASGPKTANVILVEAGSAPVPQSVIDEFKKYLNGDVPTDVDGVVILNYEVTPKRYTARTIDVVITTLGGTKSVIESAITAFIAPLTAETDGSYAFDFGGKVYADRITAAAIAAGAKNVPSLTLNGVPDGDVTLGAEELPVLGSLVVSVT